MLETQEPKYGVNDDGRLFNRETGNVIPDDEPVFILRARDIHALDTLNFYHDQCKVEGHKQVVMERIAHFHAFFLKNQGLMREPGISRKSSENPTIKRLIDKELHATMPDGSVWAIDVDFIAGNRAQYYASTGEFESLEQSLDEDTIPLFLSDEYSIEDWAENNLNWDEVKEFARMVSPPDVNYQDGWINGDKEIVDVE